MALSEHEQGRKQSLRRGLRAWGLWVLASAVGGAVGGLASEHLGIDGYVLLPGLALGAAQALVLRR